VHASTGTTPGSAQRSAARLLIAACIALLAALPAFAGDGVPLPRLRPGLPVSAGGRAPSASATPAAAPDGGQPDNPFVTKKPHGPSRFSPEQQQVLAEVSTSLNSFRTMEGQFIQFGPHGEQSEGVFFISRPGKIRFHYRPPVKLDVISDGHNVAVRDNRAMTQDFYPLSKTPLRYLLADQIDLTSDRLVSEIREEPDLLAVVIVERSAFVDGKLTLVFDRKSHDLKQWIVTDAQGLNTSVAIYNVSVGKQPDPGLFTITYLDTPHNK
jgi:outer membrane lipoprotein-sorting protein